MQHKRAKFQLNQVQLYILVNIIMAKIEISSRIIQLSIVLNSLTAVGDSVTGISKVYKRNQQGQTNILLLTFE